MEIKINALTLEGLKEYKLKSPSKFVDKFGDLDLDNLPDNWDINIHRKRIIEKKEKPPLIRDLQGNHIPETTRIEIPKEVSEVFEKVTVVEDKEDVVEAPKVTQPTVKKVVSKPIKKVTKKK